MKPISLTPEENCLVNCEKDRVYLEIIKGMSVDEMNSFCCYEPCDLNHYNSIQSSWFKTEKGLIQQRCCRELAGLELNVELMKDAELNHNMECFRVWYVFNFPDKVKRKF